MRIYNFLTLVVFLFTLTVHAGDFQWSGNYRVEGLGINNSELSGKSNKNYILQHLVLRPTITAFDGFSIYSRFDIMNWQNGSFPNNQMGQFFGSGVNSASPVGQGSNANTSNAMSGHLKSDTLAINELYATYGMEYGVVTVGRAPIHFGLGITYNNGYGAFDHWFDNKDLIAFKVLTGNFFVMPVIAKNAEGSLSSEDEVNEYMIQLQYENPESDSVFGLLYKIKRVNAAANDMPDSPIFGDASAAANTLGVQTDDWNIYFTQKLEDIKIAFELAFSKGKIGVKDLAGNDIGLNGQALVLEADWMPAEKSLNAGIKLGYVSGDDPNTTNTYEGYLLDPNYDVAFLMMNHKLGQYDVFRSSAFNNSTLTASQLPDVEVISNVIFASINAGYKFNEKWEAKANFAWATLQQTPVAGASKDVGYELDLELHFNPIKGIKWINRAGLMLPGDAFKGNALYGNDLAYGLETKAAISF